MSHAGLSDGVEEYLTVGEAATVLGVSPWTLRKWDRVGKLKPKRHPKNGYRIYRHEDLKAIRKADGIHRMPPADGSAPQVDWGQMGPAEHFVQFYESDAFLVRSVAGFIAAGLAKGDGAVVIATPSHRDDIRQGLQAEGVNVSAAVSEGRYVALDAEETLSAFMVDGSPDPERFRAVIGPIIARLGGAGRSVRAFGEMVALLWAAGNQAAAVRLEDLWNALARSYAFALFCAYPIREFGRESDGAPFRDVCACHSRVLPAESYAGHASHDDRLRSIAHLQQKAQSLEAEIAHRTQVEKALSRHQQELSDFLESSLEGLHKVGPDGTILWANRAQLNLLGYRPEEYIGQPVSKFHVKCPALEPMLAKLLSGQPLYECPAQLRARDGSIKQVLIHSTGYFEDGGFLYSRCFTRDVTALKEAEQRQQQMIEAERAARAEAERVSRMKDEFLATLSHELRTPLNAIVGWAHLIQESAASPEVVSEGISVIDRNVRAQAQLIQDLLDMSRIISGKVRIDTTPTDLAPVLEAALAAVRPAAEAKRIGLRHALDPLAGLVRADSGRIQQVAWNLLANAVKFTPPGGTIELRLARDGSQLEITVSDTGEGISPQFLPHVFERFRQADASTTRRHGGLGIGLSLVKHLVELHGGTVEARSPGPGRGASFIVSLPAIAPRQDRHLASAPAGSAAADAVAFNRSTIDLTGITALVVDDEADTRELIGRLLREHDAQVFTAASADQGIELLNAQRPHVLVSDIGMPGKDGYQLIREIRSQARPGLGQTPAIALTAFARSEDQAHALLAGFQVHLTKPIEPRELLLRVARLVGRAPN
jgi:PAS domain S-box-containing protein